MTNVFPSSNLPTTSQPWGREVQKRIETLEAQFSLQRTNSATIDAQLQASYRRLDGTVQDVQQAVADAAAAAAQANSVLDALVSLGSTGSSYNINAGNITTGTMSANRISGGTITGVTFQTATSGARIIMSGTRQEFYGSTGTLAAYIEMSTYSDGMNITNGSSYMGIFSGVTEIGQGSSSVQVTNSQGVSVFGTFTVSGGAVPSSWNTTEGTYAGSGFLASTNDGANAAAFSRLTSNGNLVNFNRGSTQVGNISVTASATTYNTTSDYRLKENVTPLINPIERLMQLKPNNFNFIIDPEIIVDGFLAHEVKEIVPGAVSGEKDEVDDDGNPVYQSIDHSKLVPLAIASIQDLQKRIQILENGA